MPTAASVDGCGGWVVVLAAERDAQGIDGLALEADSDMGADGGGDADVDVAELLDHGDFATLLHVQSGGG
ncbi:hypothetical protein [Streptomyces halstedii]|uniref:hypothetical protein n=1 Tax=Streptomyces halstedii TaxID=1944 RepID=UPI00335014A5